MARAAAFYEEAARLLREVGDDRSVAVALADLGRAARQQGDAARAAALLGESVVLSGKAGDRLGLASGLEALAGVTTARGAPVRAARLFAAAAALREAIGAPHRAADRGSHDRDLAAARARLGDEGFAAAWAEGRALTAEQAVAEALADRQV